MRRPLRSRELRLRRVLGHRCLQRAAGEPELRQRDDVHSGLDDEVGAGDPEVDDSVLNVLGYVVRAHEQQIDRRVRARDEQRPVGRLEAEPRFGAQPQRRLGHPSLGGNAESEPAVRAGADEAVRRHLLLPLPVGSIESEPVAAGPVPQPLSDARHRGGARRNALGDLEVRDVLLEQLRRLPPVRERLQLGERAEVAQEAAGLVARCAGSARRPRGRRAREAAPRRGWTEEPCVHASMLAC